MEMNPATTIKPTDVSAYLDSKGKIAKTIMIAKYTVPQRIHLIRLTLSQI